MMSSRIPSELRRFVLLAFFLSAACAGPSSGGPADETTGVVTIAITKAPADASCVRVNAAAPGGEALSSTSPLTPGQSSIITLPSVPTGPVTFTADVFAVACSALTANAVPSWVSDSVTITVVSGQPNSVTLHMHRPSSTTVVIDFPDNGGDSNKPAQSATQLVAAGKVAKSPNFKMVYTLGQPSPSVGAASSTTHELRGGLTGENGSKP